MSRRRVEEQTAAFFAGPHENTAAGRAELARLWAAEHAALNAWMDGPAGRPFFGPAFHLYQPPDEPAVWLPTDDELNVPCTLAPSEDACAALPPCAWQPGSWLPWRAGACVLDPTAVRRVHRLLEAWASSSDGDADVKLLRAGPILKALAAERVPAMVMDLARQTGTGAQGLALIKAWQRDGLGAPDEQASAGDLLAALHVLASLVLAGPEALPHAGHQRGELADMLTAMLKLKAPLAWRMATSRALLAAMGGRGAAASTSVLRNLTPGSPRLMGLMFVSIMLANFALAAGGPDPSGASAPEAWAGQRPLQATLASPALRHREYMYSALDPRKRARSARAAPTTEEDEESDDDDAVKAKMLLAYAAAPGAMAAEEKGRRSVTDGTFSTAEWRAFCNTASEGVTGERAWSASRPPPVQRLVRLANAYLTGSSQVRYRAFRILHSALSKEMGPVVAKAVALGVQINPETMLSLSKAAHAGDAVVDATATAGRWLSALGRLAGVAVP